MKGAGRLEDELRRDYPFLSEYWARRMVRHYGLETREIFGTARSADDLGEDFGATLDGGGGGLASCGANTPPQCRRRRLAAHEARPRGSTADQIARVETYMAEQAAGAGGGIVAGGGREGKHHGAMSWP